MNRTTYIDHADLCATAARHMTERAAWEELLSLPAVPTRSRPSLFRRILNLF